MSASGLIKFLVLGKFSLQRDSVERARPIETIDRKAEMGRAKRSGGRLRSRV